MFWFPPIFCNEIFNKFRRYIAGDTAGNEDGQNEVISSRIVFIIHLFNIPIDKAAPNVIIGLFTGFIRCRNSQGLGHFLPGQPGHIF